MTRYDQGVCQMKKISLIAFSAVSLTVLAACNNSDDQSPIATIDGGENITAQDLLTELQANQNGAPLLQNAFFGELSSQLLTLASEDMDITDEEIDEMIASMQEEYGAADEEELINMFSMVTSIEDREGLINDVVLPELTLMNLQSEGVDLSQENLEAHYNENSDEFDTISARHILVEDEETANEVLDRLESGDDFADLAAEFGTDGTAPTGGELGQFSRVAPPMEPVFLEAAFGLELNEVSEPVETENGFHIIEVTEQSFGFEENAEMVERAYIEQEGTNMMVVIQQLLETYDVNVEDEFYQGVIDQITATPAEEEQPVEEEQPAEETPDADEEETPAEGEEETEAPAEEESTDESEEE